MEVEILAMARNPPELGAILEKFYNRIDQVHTIIDWKIFRKIAENFEIPDEKRKIGWDLVCKASALYRITRDLQSEPDDGQSFQAVRREVAAIASRSRDLADRLGSLTEPASSWLRVSERIVDQEIFSNPATISESSFGHVISRWPAEVGTGPQISYLHLGQIVQAVSVLANMAEFALKNLLPPDKGGRPRNEALYLWVVNIHTMWKVCVDRPFTLDRHDQEPISEAARFCQQLMQTIDPSVPFAQIATAMRQVIRGTKPGRGRKRK